jgi:NAD-reducing hydrogenase large subunit
MCAARTISIDPISRLEGHGKVTLYLDEEGDVRDARFHVTQFRGYERFCQGRPFEEMPIITQRICGICPVSHQLASAKACDAILGVEIPGTAEKLRRLEHMGQFIQSHALHFFYLAAPDLLLGWDADPAVRNVVGLAGAMPDVAVKGIRLRKFGQEIISALGGKRIHPAFAVPGGVISALSPEDRERLLGGFKEAFATCQVALDIIRQWVETHRQEVETFADFDSLYAGLVDDTGCPDLYDGKLRIRTHRGETCAEFSPADYLDHIAEHVEDWSYMKFPYFKTEGYPAGCYRVGPLGRLNAADAMGTPKAQEAFEDFRRWGATPLPGGSLLYHYARIIELMGCLERAETLLADPEICGTVIRETGDPRNEEGIGIIEAPRGTLIHHYWVDRHGAIRDANLIVATGHNNIAMNRSVALVAKAYIKGSQVIKEGLLNRVEGAIRCYDPCLSCATHALGRMPMRVRILDARGNEVARLQRDEADSR